MRVPLTSGVKTDMQGEFRTSMPRNLEIVATSNKISEAQFRMASGAEQVLTGPGVDRGGAEWGGFLYRVMGTKLVKVAADHSFSEVGDVGGTGDVTFTEGFERLAINSGDKLFYLTASGLTQVTDPDLGPVKDVLWIDGYFMTTDGTSVVVTQLNDPGAVDPLKYGSAEEDPDMVVGLIKVANEAHVCGRYTIQVFGNAGTSGFPFAPQKGATIPQGVVGPRAKVLWGDSFAFVGSSRNEAIGVYAAGSGSATRISDRMVDDELAAVIDHSQIRLENRTMRGERRLLVHLPTKTLMFLPNASRALEANVWVELNSGQGQPYRIRNAVHCYGKCYVGDTNSAGLGVLTDGASSHFGEAAEWQFDAGLIYNEGKGFIVHGLELVGLPGRSALGEEPQAFLSITRDGLTYSSERPCSTGLRGEYGRRMVWRPRVNIRNWCGLRFRGYDKALPGFAALEAELSPLNV